MEKVVNYLGDKLSLTIPLFNTLPGCNTSLYGVGKVKVPPKGMRNKLSGKNMQYGRYDKLSLKQALHRALYQQGRFYEKRGDLCPGLPQYNWLKKIGF